MPDDRALGEAVDASFVDAFRRLAAREAGLVARFGSVEVAAMGLPVGFFNPIFALEPLSAPDELGAALAAVRARELPFVVHLRGTLDEQSLSGRRSGYGSAVTWAAIEDADPNATAVVLQSSPDGFPVYERMGFRTIVEYLEFEPA